MSILGQFRVRDFLRIISDKIARRIPEVITSIGYPGTPDGDGVVGLVVSVG